MSVLSLLFLLIFCLCLPSAALAEKRAALVIGNAAYRHTSELKNPKSDAIDIAVELRKLGFQVFEGHDLDKAAMDRLIRDFAGRLVGNDVAVFFYAGHGIQVGGSNYLVPIDAELNSAAGIDFELVRLDLVQRQMEREVPTNILFLDACRNNPLARNLSRAMGSRGGDIGRGLSVVEAGLDTLVSFSTQPGNVALDGQGRNSPFTAALINHIGSPAKDINSVLISVRNDVRAATRGQQVPWENSALTRQFYFKQTAAVPMAVQTTPSPSEAAQAWAATKDTTSIAVLTTFIQHFGDTIYGALARARLEELMAASNRAPAIRDQSPVQRPPPSDQQAMIVPPPQSNHQPKAEPAVGIFRERRPLLPDEERALKPKDTFVECETCPEMVVVPAGTFSMGSPPQEKGRFNWEGPQHSVGIRAPFAVGRFEVTFAEWDACVSGGGCNRYRPSDEGWGRDRRPVINVSWNDAKSYLGWLSSKTGKTYRLLTEAEWEYAARAQSNTPYFFGDDPKAVCSHGNGPDMPTKKTHPDWEVLPCSDGYVTTAPVGSFLANSFGLNDVLGNVWEWTEDCWNNSYQGAPTDGSAWVTSNCSRRILRGGAWHQHARDLRSARRYSDIPDARTMGFGFRVARSLAR